MTLSALRVPCSTRGRELLLASLMLFGAINMVMGDVPALHGPGMIKVNPYIDAGLREFADVTLSVDIDPPSESDGSLKYEAKCMPAKGASCGSSASSGVSVSGRVPNSSNKETITATVKSLGWSDTDDRYTCFISVSDLTDDESTQCIEIPVPEHEIHPRLEIFTMLEPQHSMEFDLLIQGIDAMMKMPPDNPLSWYAIAGIHGQNVTYNTTAMTNNAVSGVGGFCQHGNTLFPTFHRGYHKQIEKALRYQVEKIAGQYSSPSVRYRYKEAAWRLRFPYWDWATRRTANEGVPRVFTDKEIKVNLAPDNKPTMVRNPLRSYVFTKDLKYTDSTVEPPVIREYAVGDETARHNEQNSNISNDTLLNANVKFAADSMWIPGVYDMFKYSSNYHVFSNHYATIESQGTQNKSDYGYYPSVEMYHDTVHDVTGGRYGTMHFVPIASYDPIFWFHHCNVDRQFALWQRMNPDEWIEPAKSVQEQTMTVAQGQVVTEYTPLTPFIAPDGLYYTSHDMRDVRSLGYTYPELIAADEQGLSPDEFKETILKFYDEQRKGAFSTTWNLEVNAATSGLPGPVRIHVFLLANALPTVDTKLSGNKNYCGSVDFTADGLISKNVTLDTCLDTVEMTRYPAIDFVDPPFSEENAEDPTTRLARFDAYQYQWPVHKNSFSFVSEGEDGSDYSQYVTIGDNKVYYSYIQGTESYEFVVEQS